MINPIVKQLSFGVQLSYFRKSNGANGNHRHVKGIQLVCFGVYSIKPKNTY